MYLKVDEQGEFYFRAGRVIEGSENVEDRLPIEDHEAIVEMVEKFLEIAKDKLEEEKKIRVAGRKAV